MTGTFITKTRWFWPWQDNKEEQWLTEMSREGLHLIRPNYFGRYYFSRGEGQEHAYRLDFVTSANKKGDYYQLFQDAGWEHVGEMGGWQYWRKEVKQGQVPEIFTDIDSKIQKYRRLVGFLSILFLPLFLSILNMRTVLSVPYFTGHWIEWVFAAIWIMVLAMFFLYIFIFIRLGMRIRQLNRM